MAEEKKLKGIHVLFMFLAFFGVMLTANTIFVVKAVESFPGEKVEKSYMQGLKYNSVIAQRNEQENLGWTAQIGILKTQDNQPVLVSKWFDRAEQPLTQLNVKAVIYRPASDDGVQTLDLIANGPGQYEHKFTDLADGNWRIDITASNESGDVSKATKSVQWTR